MTEPVDKDELEYGLPPDWALPAMTAPLLPVDVQLRADAELGAAWRRCEAALPEGWRLTGLNHYGGWTASAEPTPAYRHGYWGGVPATTWLGIGVTGPTPTAALVALVERLEAL